jgi:fructokinase
VSSRIVGIGEVLWDLLPAGAQLGGAPANFAYHAQALGAHAAVISRVGNDVRGHDIRARLTAAGIACDALQTDAELPTGTVDVTIDSAGQPAYVICADVAWDAIADDATARHAVGMAHAVCFGTLAQRAPESRQAIQHLLAATPADALRILDVNLRQQFYSRSIIESSLALANVLKLNDTELPLLASLFHLSGDAHAQLAQMADRWQLRAIACTRGAHGSVLYANGVWSEHPGIATHVVDTVGAGDSFTAAMTIGLLAGWALDEINAQANVVASFVASQAGATPTLPANITAPFTALG